LKDPYLAGGTAVALQLGHRISIDFDFFTSKEFVPKAFVADLSNVGSFVLDQADKGTILGEFEGIKFSLFMYQYPLIFLASMVPRFSCRQILTKFFHIFQFHKIPSF
jgi:hypothetical protein